MFPKVTMAIYQWTFCCPLDSKQQVQYGINQCGCYWPMSSWTTLEYPLTTEKKYQYILKTYINSSKLHTLIHFFFPVFVLFFFLSFFLFCLVSSLDVIQLSNRLLSFFVFFSESQNNSMVNVGRDYCRSSGPTTLLKLGHLVSAKKLRMFRKDLKLFCNKRQICLKM